jgi:phage-related protein
MYTIEFYEKENGHRPVEEFLDSLSPKLNAKALRDIDILAEKGRGLREPYSKHIISGLFELRTQFSGDIARIFYFFYIGDKIILVNGFIKKTQKTPEEELAKAFRYKVDYERRNPR